MRVFRKGDEGTEKSVEEKLPQSTPPPDSRPESLEDMEREAAIPAKPKTTEVTAPKKKGRKATAVSEEELSARRIIARANARTIVNAVEGAKKIAAEQILGMDWSGAAILPDEELEVISILTRYLESVGFDLSNPTATLAMLILAEARITFRQYTQLRSVKEKQNETEKT